MRSCPVPPALALERSTGLPNPPPGHIHCSRRDPIQILAPTNLHPRGRAAAPLPPSLRSSREATREATPWACWCECSTNHMKVCTPHSPRCPLQPYRAAVSSVCSAGESPQHKPARRVATAHACRLLHPASHLPDDARPRRRRAASPPAAESISRTLAHFRHPGGGIGGGAADAPQAPVAGQHGAERARQRVVLRARMQVRCGRCHAPAASCVPEHVVPSLPHDCLHLHLHLHELHAARHAAARMHVEVATPVHCTQARSVRAGVRREPCPGLEFECSRRVV